MAKTRSAGRGRTAAELVRAANRWRDTYNPLRGLVISKVVSLLEQAERGDYAELQLTCRKIERRYPVVRGLLARRLAAIEKLDWDVKVMDPLPDGATESLAEEQRRFLRGRYDLVENLTDAFSDLERAEFRGYAILQKHYHRDGSNDGAVRELHWLPQENWTRDGQYGAWYYNQESQFGLGLDAATHLGDQNRIGGDSLPREDFVIRECEMALYEVYLIAFVHWSMGRKDWAAFTEIFGIPASIVIMPPNIPPEKEDEYLGAAQGVAEGSSGALPHGSDAKFPSASVRGESPFRPFCDAQDADVVLAGTGGRLAMLTADKGGLGDGPAKEHADAFDDIAQASARKISQTLQRDFDAVELEAQFPGQPVCVYFELAAPDREDVDAIVDRVVKLNGAGMECDPDEVSEKVGLKLAREREKWRTATLPGPVPPVPPVRNREDGEAFAAAIAADLQPVLTALEDRLQGIFAIADPELRLAKFRALWDELEPLRADIGRDPASAHVLATMNAAAFTAGLAVRNRDRVLNYDPGQPRGDDGKWVEIADEAWTGTSKEMHQRADSIMRGYTSVTNPQLGEVRFSADGRDKTLYEKRTPHEFQSVQALPALIERGAVVSSEPDRGGRADVKAWHKVEHGLKIGQARYRAEITIKETVDGQKKAQKFYLHRLLKNRKASSPYSADPALRPNRGPAGR